MNDSRFHHVFHCFILLLLQTFTISQANDTWVSGKNPANIVAMMKQTAYFVTEEKVDLPEKEVTNTYRRHIPTFFDARQNWPECHNIIDYRRDQGYCASCWASAAASVISDRICIGSRGRIQVDISVEDIVTCCPKCTMRAGICTGGNCFKAFRYWKMQGVVSGGNFENNMRRGTYFPDQGCKPYSHAIYNRRPPRCKQQCTNPTYSASYKEDRHRANSIYRLSSQNEKEMQYEIMNKGPVATFMHLYEDYVDYQTGVYVHKTGAYYANHFVKIVGWGEERRQKYWLIANSYGTSWGREKGMFKVIRGINHCAIESGVLAGTMAATSYQFREMIIDVGHIDKPSSTISFIMLLLSLYVM